MRKRLYLDNAATMPVSEDVRRIMMPYLTELYANPSSTYRFASKSSYAVYEAREKIASLLGAKEEEIYFTSGGSESNSWVLQGIAEAYKDKGNHIITSKIEHPSILNACKALEKKGYQISYVKVGEDGRIDINDLRRKITEETILISIMTVNNEIGTKQPIQEISKIAKSKNIIFHTDAVQAAFHMDMNVKELGIDLLSASGHKFGAPKGVGFLYKREGIKIEPLIYGGEQEEGIRGGTQNVAGIVGMGAAAELSMKNLVNANQRMTELRQYFMEQMVNIEPRVRFNGSMEYHVPSNISMTLPGVSGERVLVYLDTKGIQVSMGSSCKARSHERSYVLSAIGLTDTNIDATIRISMSGENTKEEIDYLLECITNCLKIC